PLTLLSLTTHPTSPRSTLLPYTTLFRSPRRLSQRITSFIACACQGIHQLPLRHLIILIANIHQIFYPDPCRTTVGKLSSRIRSEDRKSTRLNSSHVKISYAVFCLKKKKK